MNLGPLTMLSINGLVHIPCLIFQTILMRSIRGYLMDKISLLLSFMIMESIFLINVFKLSSEVIRGKRLNFEDIFHWDEKEIRELGREVKHLEKKLKRAVISTFRDLSLNELSKDEKRLVQFLTFYLIHEPELLSRLLLFKQENDQLVGLDLRESVGFILRDIFEKEGEVQLFRDPFTQNVDFIYSYLPAFFKNLPKIKKPLGRGA